MPRAINADMEPTIRVDGVPPALHVLNACAETRQRVGFEIDGPEFDKTGPGRRDQSLSCQSIPALQTGNLVLYPTVSFALIPFLMAAD